MALLGLGGLPLGFAGLQAGFQLNDAQDARDQRVRNLLAADVEQNVRADLMFNQGFTSPEAQAFAGLNSPFRNSANSNLQSAIGAQRALAPQAFAQANTGNFDPVNRLLGYFGDVGNVNQSNYNSVDLLGLLGGQGIAASESLQRSDALSRLQQQNLQSANPLDQLQQQYLFNRLIKQQQDIENQRRASPGRSPNGFGLNRTETSFGFSPIVNIPS